MTAPEGTAPGPTAPAYRPDQLLGAKFDTPDQTGKLIGWEPEGTAPGQAAQRDAREALADMLWRYRKELGDDQAHILELADAYAADERREGCADAEAVAAAAAAQPAPDLGAAWADLQSEIRNAVSLHCTGNDVPCDLCLRETDRAMTAVDAYAYLVAEHERTREAAAQPPGACAPDRPNAKFREWMQARGINPDLSMVASNFSPDDMRDAYEAGMTAAVVAYAGRPDLGEREAAAQPASGAELLKLADDWDKLADENDNDSIRSGEAEWAYRANELRSCAASLRVLASGWPVPAEQPAPAAAPELAAAQAALARVLSWFRANGAYRKAEVTRAQLAHAYQDGGLEVPEELRRFL